MRIRLLPRRPILIETPRFLMRSMSRRAVARATFHWSDDETVMRSIELKAGGWKLRRWRRRFPHCDDHHTYCFGVWTREGDRLIGYHTAHLQRGKVAFIGVVIGDRDWWGKGAAAETRAALIDYLFEVRGATRVWGTPYARNFPSIYNYQALRFTYEGTMRRHAGSHFGEGADVLVFGMLRDEWAAGLARTKRKADRNER